IVMQCPCERCMQDSASWNSSSEILPARRSSDMDQTLVPEPISVPRYLPESIGPPDPAIVGRSTEEAPMSSDGVVLSQPTSSTVPSIGLARSDSSTSIDARMRYRISGARNRVSPSDITGNSSGKLPASSTPALTCSAMVRKWELQGTSSEYVLQMPCTGGPSNWSCGMPRFFVQLR